MRAYRTLVWIFVLTLALSGCRSNPTPTPQPTPAPTATSVPTPQPTARPSDTPAPTPTRVPLPPVVTGVKPDRGEEQLLAAPITISFDQAMDPASTQAAFSIEPRCPAMSKCRAANSSFRRPSG